MADFVSHGVLGAGVSAGVARAFKAPTWVVGLATAYGWILGAWPDAWDWLSTKLGWSQEGVLYGLYHVNPPWYLVIQPPFFLHWVLDKYVFHKTPGLAWWDTLGWVEITMWFVSALLIWFSFWAYKSWYKQSETT